MDNPQQPPRWPLGPGQRLAWGITDNLVATAVPLMRVDLQAPLRMRRYLSLLTDRVLWMVEQEEDPQEALQQIADSLEQAGLLEPGTTPPENPTQALMEMLEDNPAFQNQLQLVANLPQSPWPVQQMPAAVEAIRRTTLAEWLDQAIASPQEGLE